MAKSKTALSEIPLKERIKIFSKTLYAIDRYFGHWEGVSFKDTDELYDRYINKVIEAKDRHRLFMAMSKLIADLNNGHSMYFDDILGSKHIGFLAFYHDRLRKWVVHWSVVAGIVPGDTIKSVDGIPVERFYKRLSKHIYGSSERMRRNDLFWPIYFPESFKVGLGNGKAIEVKKRSYPRELLKRKRISHSRIDENIGYLRIKDFCTEDGINSEAEAIKAVKGMMDCESLIIDVRGNNGGSTPRRLMRLLMDREWEGEIFAYTKQNSTKDVIESTYSGKKLKSHEYAYERQEHYKPSANHYKGRLFMLMDHGTISAAENFLMPFKMSKRAVIIGSTTAGTTGEPYPLEFGDIRVTIGAYRCWLPDGSEFEGIGIKPDIVVYPTLKDIRDGKDPVLDKAIRIIRGK
ncbi:tricorn core peptidase [Candidatus Mancarchaeum acidiphilum]|uniref:Tricorn core peptidase n=1 Tax=Candidatus Mancarchaeum acidiphilum TaxID=1920749 RepID=A0A218NMV2_9ARCH|nr:S41 family peptidase [Candidatus Mancarchaeum acidiphilum]ASI13787.1 tricorn core peptidase [Candidatus Mancarchaeum acidiphilum]